ncbi:hypothetical protein PVAND_008725 [Polypedilum vanderplanki]|uniref:Uncharacterized protein n=1 Tax=Polypedilum vanderplanki TaxID=319348 RepID=A0A9J6CB48_POLVA|nr:hypothetical protein PVAND_008725 [Polypedilum vanderplanki]
MKSLMIIVVIVIIQNANSLPQSSSNGKVVLRSISSGSNTFNGIPEIYNDLLPPLLPDEDAVDFLGAPILKNIPVLALEVEPPPLPSSAATTIKTTTKPVQTTTSKFSPLTTKKFQQISAISQNLNRNEIKFNGDDGKYRVKGETGSYRPKGNLGYYTHNNAGAYKHDDRGKYRQN